MNINRHPRECGDPYDVTPGFPIKALGNDDLIIRILNSSSDHIATLQQLNNKSHLEVRLQPRHIESPGATKVALPVRGLWFVIQERLRSRCEPPTIE